VQSGQATEKEEFVSLTESKESGLTTGSFRYYLHDNSDAFRLQFIGQITSAALAELDGCWRTARSSVAGRKVCLDLRELTAADKTARVWLKTFVANEAAECLVATVGFSDLLRNELGAACQTKDVRAGALSLRARLRSWLPINLFRRGTKRKADDPSLALARCR
jgi:hypothetical protein